MAKSVSNIWKKEISFEKYFDYKGFQQIFAKIFDFSKILAKNFSPPLLHTFLSAIFSLYILVILFNLKCSVQEIHVYILIEALSPVAKFIIPKWGICWLWQRVCSLGAVRQPYAGVNFIPPVKDYEFGYCILSSYLICINKLTPLLWVILYCNSSRYCKYLILDILCQARMGRRQSEDDWTPFWTNWHRT